MAGKSFLAELVYGKVYFLGNKEFRQGVPVAVDAETAEKLKQIYDVKTFTDGGRLRRDKFYVHELAGADTAKVLAEKAEAKAKQLQESDDLEKVSSKEAAPMSKEMKELLEEAPALTEDAASPKVAKKDKDVPTTDKAV